MGFIWLRAVRGARPAAESAGCAVVHEESEEKRSKTGNFFDFDRRADVFGISDDN